MIAMDSLVIRTATASDAEALQRLAALDSQDLAAGPHLLAELDGRAVAALSRTNGSVVADPFAYTDTIVAIAAPARRAARRRPRASRPAPRAAALPPWLTRSRPWWPARPPGVTYRGAVAARAWRHAPRRRPARLRRWSAPR
jgi:hypothetical protein